MPSKRPRTTSTKPPRFMGTATTTRAEHDGHGAAPYTVTYRDGKHQNVMVVWAKSKNDANDAARNSGWDVISVTQGEW